MAIDGGQGLNTTPPVEAGLLAKAVCQAPSMLAVPPSSRASPLPQVQHCPCGSEPARDALRSSYRPWSRACAPVR
ncbi:hypothetical protein C5612_05665 [Pseudomonas frederiksbergensis]|uniref:Uncharacterized protein n=1 Tax=Pseudomonas frederiksbergensis TaxID=104087 RepID=A0A2S8HRS8_9PSED|nr:hypothetical protein C5612_05665 [Pseudomonas frederiksbergensis]